MHFPPSSAVSFLFSISKMAEQIPYSIAENLLTKLGSAIFHEIGLMFGVGDELRKLDNTLSTVSAVLLDAEEKQDTSHAVAVWVRRLKDVVYDADDLLDDFATEGLRRKIDVRGGKFRGQVSEFFSSSNHLAFRFKMGHRIKAIRESLDDVANDISKFNFIPRDVLSDVRVRNIRGRETCSVVAKSHKILGRDQDKKQIIEMLMQSISEESLSMVGMVGMGGLGKTTLAQLVYNDHSVANHFHLKLWFCVSDEFDVGDLVKNILRSATNEDVGNLNLPLEQLQKRLQQKLNGKRYLLVLDDVWNEDVQKWGQFITLLPIGANGSQVLVTTRSTRVAGVMGIDSPYIVKGLNDEKSWELFQSLAFKKGGEKMHPSLLAIGKDIVKMCKGVPLVITTLGRVLSYKTQESHWLSIKNNKNLILLGDNNDILPVLRLSYDHLPIHLKQCFGYCALFPKDYIIDRRELVQLWMAQGYIQPLHENECLEVVGDEYFEDLLSRSLFEEAHQVEAANNDKLCYKMHDLIHDLALSIVNSEVIILTDDAKAIPKRVHHVSLFGATKKVPEDLLLMDKPIRTFLMLCRHADCTFLTNRYISSLKCSRVMKVDFIAKVPTSLGKLSHMRYLDLSNGFFENLPSVVTRLKHLQTLKLFHCRNLKEWPRNMEKLINLRHLEIDDLNRLRYMPGGLGELTQLQTLPLFWVAGNDGGWHKKRSTGGGLSELKLFNNLRGQLVIEGLSNATGRVGGRGGREAANYHKELAVLEGKQYLESLRLHWSECMFIESEEEVVQAVSVMESLQPHKNLKKLSIKYYGGERFPNWMMNDQLDLLLPNLVMIEILYCKRCQVLPPFGQLPSLQYLHLQDLGAVEYMKELDYPSSSAKPFFPSLKRLRISKMPRSSSNGWKKWPDVAAHELAPPSYPYLENLQLSNITAELCLQLIICASSSLKYLKILNIEDLISLPPLGLEHLSPLQTLSICHCKNLESLPDSIGCLTALRELEITSCPKLTSLPEEIQSLRILCTLKIHNCLYLYLKYWERIDRDWRQISHIPNIIILYPGRNCYPGRNYSHFLF